MERKTFSIKTMVFYLLVAALLFLALIPILWSVLLSFKTNNEIVNAPLSLPDSLSFDNYQRALDTINFPRMYANTLILVAVSVFFSICLTFMSSFAIARLT